MEKKFHQFFWGAALLAAALVAATFLATGAFREAKAADNSISVTGSAKEAIVSDLAVWRFGVRIQGSVLKEAYAGLQSVVPLIDRYLESRGIPASEIDAGALTAGNETWYDEDDRGRRIQHVQYYASRQYVVTSGDLDRLEQASRNAGDLIGQGVALDSQPLEYLYTKLADLRTNLLRKATEDAKGRAQAIAESSGAKIGPIRSARMGVFQITPRNSTIVDDYGISDTSSREKDVTAVVGAEFRLR